MKYLLLLFLTVKTIYGFGFGLTQSLQPFHMQFDMPAMPISLMSPMQFPAIFNPMEAMQRETSDPEARGMDNDEPMANVTTKNQTEIKDGFKITTITRNGPGFHSYVKEYEKDGNGTKNGTGMDFAQMMGGSSLFKIMQQLRNGGKPHERKCKKCGKGKFCDPIFHLCRKKFAEGRTCMFQKQCGKSLKCQWGKCQKARKGDPGTFCKGNAECNGNSCCRNTPGSFHLMCIPRQAEGAICGLKKESFADVLYIVKRSTAPTCSPCQDELKCADTGDSKSKRCVKLSYAEIPTDGNVDDKESNTNDDDDEGKDDGGLPNLLSKQAPPSMPPARKPARKPKGHKKKNNKDEKKEDDESEKIDNGEGISIKASPSSKGKTESKGKSKKEKSS